MIPRRIFVLVDASLVVGAFILAHTLIPWLWPVREELVIFARRVALDEALYFWPVEAYLPTPLSEQLWMLVVITPAVLLALVAVDAYGRLGLSRTRIVLAGPFASGVGLSLATLVIFLLKIQEWSRLFLFTFAGLTATALTGVRAFIFVYHQWKAKGGYYRRNLLLIGPPDSFPRLSAFLESSWSEDDFRVIGYLSTSPQGGDTEVARVSKTAFAEKQPAMTSSGLAAVATCEVTTRIASAGAGNLLGSALEIEAVLPRHPIHEVVVILQNDAMAWMREVVCACDHVGVPLSVVPEVLLSCTLANLVVSNDVRHRRKVPAILLAPRVWDSEALHLKRLVDLTVSLVALVFLAPVFAVVGLLVRVSGPGPILHRYYMVGQNGKYFSGQKFRTMVPNAHELKEVLLAHNEMTGPVFKMKDDPRITKVGRWLRKFSLDELPQLYSVLKGDLSLVGPRPAGPDEFERYEFWHLRKVSVKPGITCLWQVRGRNAISSFDEWVKMDLEYIDRWSLWLDFKILVRTLWVVVKGTGQ